MKRLLPLFTAIAFVVGLIMGYGPTQHLSWQENAIFSSKNGKLNTLLHIINQSYVDTVDVDSMVEEVIPKVLNELDPHSSYISAKYATEAEEELKGSFSGIGVRFMVQEDTVHVMEVIKGGPSEKVGLLAGDRIIQADTTVLVGKSNRVIMSSLKGEKGSTVKIGVKRRNQDELQWFSIVRDDIPVQSVDASYMINDSVGYVHISNFGEQTYAELLIALARFKMQGMSHLVLDFRGNHGGYMHIAIQMANEFLSRNKLLVYSEGVNSPRNEFHSDGKGSFQSLPLVVLVDEGSASASEIFAGAMQDNDRAIIIGKRTFGKGLVQQPITFHDGSVVRLTVARYYTPSGRCIQKPYTKGHKQEYEMELIKRYERGEFYSQDSIHHSGPAFKTSIGRTVYGGGGIMPDYFIPDDTTLLTSYYKEALVSGLLAEFSFKFADQHRHILDKFHEVEDMVTYMKRQNITEQFARFAEQRKLKRRNLMLAKSKPLFERYLYGRVIYNVKSTDLYVQFINQSDPDVLKALELIAHNKCYPSLSQETTPTQVKS